MNPVRPPRLAAFLLGICLRDNDPLAGDLLEEFDSRQSRLWFWRQVIHAIVMEWLRADRHPAPLRLGLADGPLAAGGLEMGTSLETKRTRRAVNMTASPIRAVGGLGLVALVVLVAIVRPDAWWALVYALLGGLLLGLTFILIRRRQRGAEPNHVAPGGASHQRPER